jgi:hypothetical protein
VANNFGNTNAQNRTKCRILIDLNKRIIGDLLTLKTIKLLYPRQNMTLRKLDLSSETIFVPSTQMYKKSGTKRHSLKEI